MLRKGNHVSRSVDDNVQSLLEVGDVDDLQDAWVIGIVGHGTVVAWSWVALDTLCKQYRPRRSGKSNEIFKDRQVSDMVRQSSGILHVAPTQLNGNVVKTKLAPLEVRSKKREHIEFI